MTENPEIANITKSIESKTIALYISQEVEKLIAAFTATIREKDDEIIKLKAELSDAQLSSGLGERG